MNDILIPRFYDPRIENQLEQLSATHEHFSLDQLVEKGFVRHDHGDYVPKIHYGTGVIPYLRTSDLANWELKASPKHGVSQEIFDEYGPAQDVREEDIFFVHEGTYLIGAVAMTTKYDGPALYQHHLAKFRVLEASPFNSYFLLASFESPIVQLQIRSKQFSADIIDSVVGRLGQVMIPVPRDAHRLRQIETEAQSSILGRAKIKEELSYMFRELDGFLRGESEYSLQHILSWTPAPRYAGQTHFLNYRTGFNAFLKSSTEVHNDILLPRYYDPVVAEAVERCAITCTMVGLGDLVSDGLLEMTTGDEIGRLNYGTGTIPFVRTSDFGSWELKREAKQGVSQEVYDEWSKFQDARPGDILLVRDGTYLIGSSVLLCDADLPLLYCGGIIRIRCLKPDQLSPAMLFTLLNLPMTIRQIRNKQFTRDVIDTLGNRLGEVLVPLPSDKRTVLAISEEIGSRIEVRNAMRGKLEALVSKMYS